MAAELDALGRWGAMTTRLLERCPLLPPVLGVIALVMALVVLAVSTCFLASGADASGSSSGSADIATDQEWGTCEKLFHNDDVVYGLLLGAIPLLMLHKFLLTHQEPAVTFGSDSEVQRPTAEEER